MRRLSYAENAIKFTKRVISKGAGNQAPALRRSGFNSYERMQVVRGDYWDLDPELEDIAARAPSALRAAKTIVAKGGNCGEHANLAYHYLDATAKGETIHRASHTMDHAFALIGPLESANMDCSKGPMDEAEVAVADPWPTKATAVLWQDFFARESLPSSRVTIHETMVADGESTVTVLAAGLSLNEEGKELVNKRRWFWQTNRAIRQGAGSWVWNQPRTYDGQRPHYFESDQEVEKPDCED